MYTNTKDTTATVTTMAMAREMVKRNMMRPEKNKNTEMWSGKGINPIACDMWYFWVPRNKQVRTRSWSPDNSSDV